MREVLGAALGLGGEVRLRADPHFVVRGLEAPPQLVGLRPRNIGSQPPLLLKLADLAGNRFGILERAKRLHLRAEPLLDADVRPALPLIGFTELQHFGRQHRQQRLEAARDIVGVLLAWQQGHSGQRHSNLAQGAIGRLQGQIGTRHERFDAAEEMLHAGERFTPRLGVGRARFGLARHDLGLSIGEPGGQSRFDVHPGSEIDPFTPCEPEALARFHEVRIRRGRRGGVRELRQTQVGPLGLPPGVFFRSHSSLLGRLFRCLDPGGLFLGTAAAGLFLCRAAVLLLREILERRSRCWRWRGISGVGTGHAGRR